MEAWGAIVAHGGEKSQANLELKEQRAAHVGKIRLNRGELRPRDH
jgi:hypothetical protein